MAIARPYVQQTLARRLSPHDLLKDLASEVSTLGSLAHRLPAQIDQLLHDFETGNLQIRAVTPRLNRAARACCSSRPSRLSLALFAAVMSLCAAIVLTSTLPETWRLVLAIALGLLATGAWLILLGWHFVRGQPLKLAPLLKLFRRN